MRLNQLAAILLAVLHNAAKCQICCVIFVFTPIYVVDLPCITCTLGLGTGAACLALGLIPGGGCIRCGCCCCCCHRRRSGLNDSDSLRWCCSHCYYELCRMTAGTKRNVATIRLAVWHFCFRWHFVYVINLTSFKICANNYFTTILFIGTHTNIDRRLSVQVHIHVQLGKLETAVRERMLIDRQGCTAHLRLKYRYFNEWVI